MVDGDSDRAGGAALGAAAPRYKAVTYPPLPASMAASCESPCLADPSFIGLASPLAQGFGLVGEAIGEDQARVRLPWQPGHTNSHGDIHGGALAVLFDCTLAAAARAHAPAEFGVVTVDFTIHFLQPARGDVVATARCEQRGRSLCFVRGEAHDDQGRLLALASGSFKLVPRAPEALPADQP